MVPDSVESFGAEVEGGKSDVGSPFSVVVTTVDIGGEGILTGVSTGAVATVMTKSDGFDKRNVQTESGGDGPGDLGDL